MTYCKMHGVWRIEDGGEGCEKCGECGAEHEYEE